MAATRAAWRASVRPGGGLFPSAWGKLQRGRRKVPLRVPPERCAWGARSGGACGPPRGAAAGGAHGGARSAVAKTRPVDFFRRQSGCPTHRRRGALWKVPRGSQPPRSSPERWSPARHAKHFASARGRPPSTAIIAARSFHSSWRSSDIVRASGPAPTAAGPAPTASTPAVQASLVSLPPDPPGRGMYEPVPPVAGDPQSYDQVQTEMHRSINATEASVSEGNRSRWHGRRWLKMQGLLFTGGAMGFVGEAGKRFGLSRALSPGRHRVGDRLATGGRSVWPEPIEHEVQP